MNPLAIFCSSVVVRQQIAGQLPDGELIERHVVVQGLDQPVAPDPLPGVAVLLEPVAVGVTGGVEPWQGHPLAVMRAGEQAVDEVFVGLGASVGDEGIDLLGRRRQSRQVEGHAPQERRPAGFGAGVSFSASSRGGRRRRWDG